jgi:hypothetical protein
MLLGFLVLCLFFKRYMIFVLIVISYLVIKYLINITYIMMS